MNISPEAELGIVFLLEQVQIESTLKPAVVSCYTVKMSFGGPVERSEVETLGIARAMKLGAYNRICRIEWSDRQLQVISWICQDIELNVSTEEVNEVGTIIYNELHLTQPTYNPRVINDREEGWTEKRINDIRSYENHRSSSEG